MLSFLHPKTNERCFSDTAWKYNRKTENKLDYSEMTENESCTDFTLHRHSVGLLYNNTVIIIL